jgi:bacterioferritin B
MMITQDVADALNVHMGREFGAHFQYLALSGWFDGEGLPELAGFFAAQASEEHTHAMKFWRYVQDAGATLAIPAVQAPRGTFATADEAVSAALEWEIAVTRHIDGLVRLAREHSDYATETFLHWFVTEQVEEVATMSQLQQVVRRAGESNLLQVEDYVARKLAAGGSPATTEA